MFFSFLFSKTHEKNNFIKFSRNKNCVIEKARVTKSECDTWCSVMVGTLQGHLRADAEELKIKLPVPLTNCQTHRS